MSLPFIKAVPPGGMPPPPPMKNQRAVLLAYIRITDTNIHTYRTDYMTTASTPLGSFQYGIALLALGFAKQAIRAYKIFVYNAQDQPVTVVPITAITDDGLYPDQVMVDYQFTVDPYTGLEMDFDFQDAPAEYISLALSFAAAPSNSGYVLAYLFTYLDKRNNSR